MTLKVNQDKGNKVTLCKKIQERIKKGRWREENRASEEKR